MKKLNDEILVITLIIKDKFPEYYALLDETPLHISNYNKAVNLDESEQYLRTIKAQLKQMSNEK